MDLGFLIIANLIMRTRLPPKARAGKALPLKEVLDVPYLLFVFGSFLVSWLDWSKHSLTRIYYSYSGESLSRVRINEVVKVRLTEPLMTSLLPATSRCCSSGFSDIRKIFGAGYDFLVYTPADWCSDHSDECFFHTRTDSTEFFSRYLWTTKWLAIYSRQFYS